MFNVCVNIILVCIECGDCNYIIIKNKCNNFECIEMKKYCLRLNKYMLYCEIK